VHKVANVPKNPLSQLGTAAKRNHQFLNQIFKNMQTKKVTHTCTESISSTKVN